MRTVLVYQWQRPALDFFRRVDAFNIKIAAVSDMLEFSRDG